MLDTQWNTTRRDVRSMTKFQEERHYGNGFKLIEQIQLHLLKELDHSCALGEVTVTKQRQCIRSTKEIGLLSVFG